MVKITNGVNIFEVPSGAYKSMFQAKGYRIVSEPKKVSVAPPDASGDKPEAKPQEGFEELLEKPISQWNKHEVKAFAASKGIDLVGTKTIDEAKDRIKESLGL